MKFSTATSRSKWPARTAMAPTGCQDDELPNDFLRLAVDQLQAAQAVFDDACALLIRAELDVSKVLPKELVECEQSWVLKVLKAPARGELEKYAGQPTASCEANLDLMLALNAMPSPAAAFRILHASGE